MLVYEKEERTKERKVPAVVSPPVPHEFLHSICAHSTVLNETTVIH